MSMFQFYDIVQPFFFPFWKMESAIFQKETCLFALPVASNQKSGAEGKRNYHSS